MLKEWRNACSQGREGTIWKYWSMFSPSADLRSDMSPFLRLILSMPQFLHGSNGNNSSTPAKSESLQKLNESVCVKCLEQGLVHCEHCINAT